MSPVLDSNPIFIALLGALLGATLAWGAWRKKAQHDVALQSSLHADELHKARETLNEKHAADKQALEKRSAELADSLAVELAEASMLKAELDRQAHAAKDQVHALEQRNNALTIKLDLATSQLEELKADRDQLKQEHNAQLEAIALQHAGQIEKAESPLTVIVHPFVNTSVDKALFKKTSRIDIGYKYQLMVQGIPCLEPHSFVVETQTQSEVDADAIRAFGEKALALAEAAAQVKGGGVAGTLISVAKTVVFGRK
jgi:hypothetical protein